MDAQSFDYWMAQGRYVTQVHQSTVFGMPPDPSKVPSLSGSPVSSTYDQSPTTVRHAYYPQMLDEQVNFGAYAMPLTPSDFGSDNGSLNGSPRPLAKADPVFSQSNNSVPAEKTHTTSGRRRAQNRAAQRAFRERKEKHARDLEGQLSVLTDKYNKLENSHSELNAAYEKLRKTIELLTQDDDEDAEGEDDDGKSTRRRNNNSYTTRKLLEILHGEFKGAVPVRAES